MKELELSERNSMVQEAETKELEKPMRGSGKSGAEAECRVMDIERVFEGREIFVIVSKPDGLGQKPG
jgi:hypothetical protein